MSDFWILGASWDTADHYETLSDIGNGAIYRDISDGAPDRRVWRRGPPSYKAETDAVFPDIVPAIVMPPLWSRRMVAALEAVAPDHGCLIYPAYIKLAGRRGALPWTHDLVAPTIYLRDLPAPGSRAPAPVVMLGAHSRGRQLLGLSAPVAEALAALMPRGTYLAPLEDYDPALPSFDRRLDPAEIAAWKAAEAARPGEPVPEPLSARKRLLTAIRADGGFVLRNGEWLEPAQDDTRWRYHYADGRIGEIGINQALDDAERSLLPRGDWGWLPVAENKALLKEWRKATKAELAGRLGG